MSMIEGIKVNVASEEKFPPTETIEVSITREDITNVISDPRHGADDVIRLFAKDFGYLFAQSAGTIQGYTLGQHTRMVLKQYHKYFKHTVFPAGLDNVFFETVLALHDIGKPEAVKADNVDDQYSYHLAYFRQILPKLGFSAAEITVASSLIGSDPIREYLYKNRTEPSAAAAAIISKAAAAGMSIKDYWFLLKLMWMCDAGSYTVDAGGHAELDRMFEFEPDDGEMNLAPHMKVYFYALEQKLGVNDK